MSDVNQTVQPDEPAASAQLDDVQQVIETAASGAEKGAEEVIAAVAAAPASAAESQPVFTLPVMSTSAESAQPAAAQVSGMGAGSSASADDKLMAALAWAGLVLLQVPLVSIILLLAEGNKDRPFQRHHALQSIGFFVAAIAYEIVAAIVFTIGSIVTLGCGALILWLLFFVPHIAAIYYAWQAYQGRELNIPLVTQVMRQQGWLA